MILVNKYFSQGLFIIQDSINIFRVPTLGTFYVECSGIKKINKTGSLFSGPGVETGVFRQVYCSVAACSIKFSYLLTQKVYF